ncbi:hypothetical protein J1605_017433 [Eschrichtius robustus]|uniref:Uncharacterized protein n=1 Tax=Eschrichtius robustus TaxID=9764 RepID=A0AB34I1N4_ESCRO|nr:hypothetical protein J1605_017433 [Eschrichtius robustus]
MGAGLGAARGGVEGGGLGAGLCASALHPRRVSCSTAEAPLGRRRAGIRNPSCTVCARPTSTRTRTRMKQVCLFHGQSPHLVWARSAHPATPVIHKDLAEGAEFYNITSLIKLAEDRIRGDSKTSQLRVTHVHRGLQGPGAELPQTGSTRPTGGGRAAGQPHRLFLQRQGCGERGPLFIAVRGPLTIAASLAAEHRLSNCGSGAQLLRDMWDPPRPGPEPCFRGLWRRQLDKNLKFHKLVAYGIAMNASKCLLLVA